MVIDFKESPSSVEHPNCCRGAQGQSGVHASRYKQSGWSAKERSPVVKIAMKYFRNNQPFTDGLDRGPEILNPKCLFWQRDISHYGFSYGICIPSVEIREGSSHAENRHSYVFPPEKHAGKLVYAMKFDLPLSIYTKIEIGREESYCVSRSASQPPPSNLIKSRSGRGIIRLVEQSRKMKYNTYQLRRESNRRLLQPNHNPDTA